MNKIHQNVIIRNMYEELEGYEKPITCKTPTKKASLTELSEGLTMEKRPDHNAYRVFKNGLYIKYISLNNDGSLQFIDYFDENRYRTKRETYDPWGNLKKIAYMDLPLNKPRQLIYYDTNGKAFLTQWNNPNNGKVQRIWLFDKNSSIINSYVNDNVTYKVQWLHQTIDRLGGSQSVVISDTRSTDEILINLNHPKAAKVWRLHSNHLNKPNNGKVQRIWLFDKNSSIINSYVNDNVTYKVQWLHQTIDRLGGSQSVVISDTRSTDEILINLNHPKAAKVWRLHSNHLDK